MDEENEEYRTAVWIDALEDIDPSGPAVEEDEEYDELDEMSGEDSKKRKRKGGRGQAAKAKAGVMPKRFLPRSLGTILVEEASREDGATRAFLAAEARAPPNQQLPRRKFCPVTGLRAAYVEPKSGIPYATYGALEQIRERPPPWMTLGGAATYWEAVKSIEEE
jgi:hypothetical protein